MAGTSNCQDEQHAPGVPAVNAALQAQQERRASVVAGDGEDEVAARRREVVRVAQLARVRRLRSRQLQRRQVVAQSALELARLIVQGRRGVLPAPHRALVWGRLPLEISCRPQYSCHSRITTIVL